MVRPCTQDAGYIIGPDPPVFRHTEMGVIHEEPRFWPLLHWACLNEQIIRMTLGEDHPCFDRLLMSAAASSHMGRTGLGNRDIKRLTTLSRHVWLGIPTVVQCCLCC